MECKYQKFGERIRERRVALQLSQEELAERLDVSRQAVAKWESGKSFPSTERLLELCRVLEISAEEMLGEVVHKAQKEKENNKAVRFVLRVFLIGLAVAVGLYALVFLLNIPEGGFGGFVPMLYFAGIQLATVVLLWCRLWIGFLVVYVLIRVLRKT